MRIMNFAIVCFTEEKDSLGVVSTNWISFEQTFCWYPALPITGINTLLKARVPPSKHWLKCQIKILKFFETYEIAMDNLSDAERTSKLKSDEDLKGKGCQPTETYNADSSNEDNTSLIELFHKLTQTYSSDSSDEDSSSLIQDFYHVPSPTLNTNSPIKTSSAKRKKSAERSVALLESIPINETTTKKARTESVEADESQLNTDKSIQEEIKAALKKTHDLLLSTAQDLTTSIKRIESKLDDLLATHSTAKDMECITEKIKESILSVLPYLTEDILKKISENLVNDGITEISDLCHVEDADLIIMKPIERRKLLKAWKESQTKIVLPPVSFETNASSSKPHAEKPVISKNLVNNWETFAVPWQQMPNKLMQNLEEGERLSPALKRKLVQIIADSMHKVSPRPGRKAIGIVSQKIVEKYTVLKDTLCGETFQTGNFSLFKALENRLEYLNRGHGDKIRKIITETEHDPSKMITRKISKYACINWQPDSLPECETEATQNMKKEEMIKIISMEPKIEEERIISLLNDTFFSQRKEINSGENIKELLKKWPALFTKIGMEKHFEMLVGINLRESIMEKLKSKGKILIESIKSTLSSSKKSQSLQLELNNFEDNEPNLLILVVLLINYFKEQRESLFIFANISTTHADAAKLDLPSNPCLIVCGRDFFTATSFMLAIDHCIVDDSITSFEDGLLMLFAAFYNFNICYPSTSCSTLEFIQRCLANINPEKGSRKNRSQGKKFRINPKVLTLLNTIADYEWLS